MKTILILLTTLSLSGSLFAQTLSETYKDFGELFVAKLDSAPFPHPDRAKGHTYHDKFYSAEKNYSDNSVAFFVPKGFRATERTDYVIHFHGWMHHITTTFSGYRMVEQFCESGRNAILIVPQGPYDAPDSFGGKLEDTNGFRNFMAEVTQVLDARRIIHSPAIGDIILSGHSGGYHVIAGIVARGGISEHVQEVFLFDALYGNDDNFTQWFKNYPNRRMIDIYTLHGGTKEESEKVMAGLKSASPPTPFLSKNEADITTADLRNHRLIFIYSPLQHHEVIFKKDQFRDYLKTSGLEPIRKFSSPKGF